MDWYGNVVMPALERNGFDVIGAFKRSTGPMGEDVLLMRFADLAAYEKAGASLQKDTPFLDSVARVGTRWNVSERAKVAVLAPYASELRLEQMMRERPDNPRHYLLAVLSIAMGGEARAFDLIAKLVSMSDAGGGTRLATAYATTMGQRGELTDLWASSTAPDMTYHPGDPLAELIAELREVAPEESICLLNPLPYSRLQ